MKLFRSVLILLLLGVQLQAEAFSIPVRLKQVMGYIGSTVNNKTTHYYGSLKDYSATILQSFKKSFSGIRNFSLFSFVPSWLQGRHNVQHDLSQHSISQSTLEDNLTFQKLLDSLQSEDDWEQLLKNKKLHHKMSVLIADHLMGLVNWVARITNLRDFGLISIRLDRFFSVVDYESISLIKKSVTNNFEELIEIVHDEDLKGCLIFLNIVLESFIRNFVFFGKGDMWPQLSDGHYTTIFLNDRLYIRNKKILTARLLSASSLQKETTVEWIKKHIDEFEFNVEFLVFIFEQLGSGNDAEQLLHLLYNKHKGDFLKLILINGLAKKIGTSLGSDIHCGTIHEKHIVRNCELVMKSPACVLMGKYAQDSQLKALFNKINEKTRELQEDYYVFVHAQRIKFYPIEQWYTALRSLVDGPKELQDYCYPWIAKLPAQDNFSFWFEDSEDISLQETLIRHGGQYAKVLFMNYTFFGNMSRLGSSSAYYFLLNANSFRQQKTSSELLYDIFNLLKLDAIYKKYEIQLNKHADTFDQLSNYGNILLIAVPKKNISQSVYLSHSDATRRKIDIEGVGKTGDIGLIMETLEKNPEKIKEDTDLMEFCLTMTQSPYGGGLNPKSGIKIIAFNCIEPEKLQKFEQEKNELLAMMADDIKALKKLPTNNYNQLNKSKL